MLYRLKLPPELAALKPHPHMLRHACGFDLVGRADLQARAAFMGHKRLENTVRYSGLRRNAGVGGLATFFCPGVLDPARRIEKGPLCGDGGPSIWES